MSSMDSGLGIVEQVTAATSITDTDSTVVETPTQTPTNDQTVDTTKAEATETTEQEEINPLKDDGTEKTEAEIAQEKTERESAKVSATDKAGDPLPKDVTKALQAFKNADPANAKMAKEMNGIAQRYFAMKPLLGDSGVSGLRDLLADAGAKTIADFRQTYEGAKSQVEAINATDELLYAGDPELCKNVYADMEAAGKAGVYGKVVANFIEHLKQTDEAAYYDQVSKPNLASSLAESEFPKALNNIYKALEAGDTQSASANLELMVKWWNDLHAETSEKSKISKERQAWEAEKTKAGEAENAKARAATENGIAEECEKNNNTKLGKALNPFVKMAFFKEFKRENWIPLGNEIKNSLYAELKADKAYQLQMNTMWKAKGGPDRAKMVEYHNSKVDDVSTRLVAAAVKKLYPGYAKGGSAAGRAAASAEVKAGQKAADAKSTTTGKAIYVASRPEKLMRDGVVYGGRKYEAKDLDLLQITGKGFIQGTNGPRLITWRKQ